MTFNRIMQEASEEKPQKKWYKKWWGTLIIVLGGLILIILLIFVGQVYYYYRQIKNGAMPISGSAKFTESGKFMKTNSPSTSSGEIDPQKLFPEGEPSSSPGVSLAVVGFFDFQCPFSKEAYPILREMQKLYDNKVNFVFRNFPLTEIHPDAMLAAQAGECAHLQNKFWLMSDKLFGSKNLTEADLKLYANQIGLDENQFVNCLNSYQGKGQVFKDVLDGQTFGVRGTPTWFINGEKIEGVIPSEIFKKIIDYFLAKQKP